MLYGGDEIGALVFDPGHHSIRVGYAQEDTPKAEIPAVVGVGPDETNANSMDLETKPDNNITTGGPSEFLFLATDLTSKKLRSYSFLFIYFLGYKYYVDTTYLNVPRSNLEIQSYMKDGMIENWDLFEKVLDYVYAKVRPPI